MKKTLGFIAAIAMAVTLMIGIGNVETKAAEKINSTPQNNETVNLLKGKVYDFAANWTMGAVSTYFDRYSNTYYPTPLTISWDNVDGTPAYDVKIGTKEDLSDAKAYVSGSNSIQIENLFAGYDYYYEVSTTVSGTLYSTGIVHIKTANLPRTIKLSSVNNTRDVGGCYTTDGKKRVKQGVWYRGARLDSISQADKETMKNVLGIKTVFDLREPEKAQTSSVLGEGTNFINISAPQYLDNKNYTKIGVVGEGISNPANWPTLKQEVEVFVDESNYPIYMHCRIGRDRTGTLGFLIEGLIGMSEADIYRDYELSFFASESNNEVSDPATWEKVRMGSMMNYIKTYEGNNLQECMTTYMKKSLGLTDEQLNKVKANLLYEETGEPNTTVVEPTTAKPIIRPARVKIKKAVNSKKRAIVLTYKRVKNAKGYQVVWSKTKKFKKATKKYVKKIKYTIKRLKKGKTYFVKVRAYNLNGKEKVFGKFSKVKRVEVKK